MAIKHAQTCKYGMNTRALHMEYCESNLELCAFSENLTDPIDITGAPETISLRMSWNPGYVAA